MKVLLVCHSAGDSALITQTAHKLAAESKATTINLLVVGKAAKSKIDSEKFSPKINVISLESILNTPFATFENTTLNTEELLLLQEYLKKLAVTHALIGTPSLNNAAVPYQIAELLSQEIQAGFIYDDYLFTEAKHVKRGKIQEKGWPECYQWLLPLSAAAAEVKELNPKLKTEVVGHLAFVAAVKASESKMEFTPLHKTLQNEGKNKLIFISGGKSVIEDLQLLTSITTIFQQNEFNEIDVRIGLHPGLDDVNTYLSKMLLHLIRNPVKNSIQFIIDSSMQKRIQLEQIKQTVMADLNEPEKEGSITKELSTFLRIVDIRGDQAAAVADGVMCFVPATLVSQAVVQGKPAACYQGKPYLPADKLLVGPTNFGRFFKLVSEAKTATPLSGEEFKLHPVEAIVAKFK